MLLLISISLTPLLPPDRGCPLPSAPAPSRGAASLQQEQMGLQGQGRGGGGGAGGEVGCKDQNPKLTVAECGRLPPGSRPRQLGWKGRPGSQPVCKAPGEFVNKPSNFQAPALRFGFCGIQEGSTRRPLLWIHPWGRLHCQVQSPQGEIPSSPLGLSRRLGPPAS